MSNSARFVRLLIVLGVASAALLTNGDRVGAVAGALDPTFGSGGYRTAGFGNSSDLGRAMVVQSDGKMVVVGSSFDGANSAFGVARFNTDGSLDTSFDGDGKVITHPVPGTNVANAVAIQSDGKIVAAGEVYIGTGYRFGLARYNTNGSLDTSFSTDGIVTTAIGTSSDVAYDVAIQSDGKIVAVGMANSGSSNFAVVRFNTDGSLDTTFDGDGKAVTAAAIGDNWAKNVVIQTDGKIVAVGWTITIGDFAAIRYNTDGSLDATFGTGGKVLISVVGSGDYANAVALQTDGKIVIAGDVYNGANYDIGVVRLNTNGTLDTTFSGDGKTTATVLADDDSAVSVAIQTDGKVVVSGQAHNGVDFDIAVVRFTATGVIDSTFSGDGRVTTAPFSGNDLAGSVAVRSDGKLLVGGYTNPSSADFAVLLYNTNGSLDTAFDTDGIVTADIGNSAATCKGVAIQNNGRIIAVGSANSGTLEKFSVARSLTDGTLDPSYGTNGLTITPVGTRGSANAVAIQLNAKSVVVGTAFNGTDEDIAVVRYESDGTLDTGFDTDGIAILDLGGANDYGKAVALQPNGKIVVAGYTNNGANTDFVVARFELNGTLDTTFGTGGIVVTPVLTGIDHANAVAIQSDGKIVVGGYAEFGMDHAFALVRYESDGSIDNSFGTLGRVVSSLYSGWDEVNSLAIQSDGKIIAAGFAADNVDSDFGTIRYNTDGTLDTTFDGDGKVTTDLSASGDTAYSVAVQTDGKIVVSGDAFTTKSNFGIVRYLADGSLDATFNLADASPLGTGKATLDVSGGDQDVPYAMAIDGAGRFLLGGIVGDRFAVARVLGDAPTAANVTVAGRVTTTNGTGVRNAIVSLTDSNGTVRTAITSSLGYFRFDDIAAGQTYIVSANAKRHNFAPRTITVTDAINDLDLIESEPGLRKQ